MVSHQEGNSVCALALYFVVAVLASTSFSLERTGQEGLDDNVHVDAALVILKKNEVLEGPISCILELLII